MGLTVEEVQAVLRHFLEVLEEHDHRVCAESLDTDPVDLWHPVSELEPGEVPPIHYAEEVLRRLREGR